MSIMYPYKNLSAVILVIFLSYHVSSQSLQNEIKETKTYDVKWPTSESTENDSHLNNVTFPEPESTAVNLPVSKKQESSKKGQHVKTDTAIEFQENKSKIERNPVFFTQAQKMKTDAILYPNNPTYSKNRLPLPAEELVTLASAISTATPQSIKEDEFLMGENQSYEDTIKSMQLTLDIVGKSFWDDENVVFSPLSVYNVLAVLLLGSEGRTYHELLNVLHLAPENITGKLETRNDAKFHKDFKKLLRNLGRKSESSSVLDIANQIFVDKSFDLLPSYEKNARDFYGTRAESFNFGRDGKQFVEKVNSWVDQKTHGKITSVISEPPSSETTLAFINAVYFRGTWETPFLEKMTRSSKFFVSENETLNVPMMINEINVPYLYNPHYQLVSIPYKDNVTSFFIILPSGEGVEGLKMLEKKFSRSNISTEIILEKIGQMKNENVVLKIPKMKISTDGHMKNILSSMGIPSVFERNTANFSRISTTDGLHLSAIHHRAMMEVNERGTEAAAVTFGTAERIFDPPVQFVANKPFMFFIYHMKTKAVLFWGRMIRPEWH